MTQSCPPRTQLERLLLDQLDPNEDEAVSRHIEGCSACQAALDQLSREGDPSASKPSVEDATDAIEGMIRRLKKRSPKDTVGHESGPAKTDFVLREEAEALPQLPSYEILEQVGKGGMGVIYRARQINLNRLVALKMLRPGGPTSRTALARLRGEASVIARLHHPNIVQIHEVGEHAGQPYLSLEFMEGGSLRQRLDGKPRPADDAAALVEIVARAVDAAHARGIIHRDLKPANILFDKKGTAKDTKDTKINAKGIFAEQGEISEAGLWSQDVPKVADFGLAKLLDSEADSGGPLTRSGEVVGTPSYMAPEQARGKGVVGPAADVYALGTVLYEMLTGRPPFVAETSLGTLLRVVHEEPISVSRLSPSVPRDLATIAMKCLEKEPARRYATAGELADDLARFRAGQTVLARPLGRVGRTWRWCRRNRLAAGLLAALIFVFAAGFGISLWQALAAHAHAEAESQARKEAVALQLQAERVAASSILDQGLARCRQGDIALGLLLFADSLDKAERAGADDLSFVIRCNLSAWSRHLLSTATITNHGSVTQAIAVSPDGRIAATGTLGDAWNKPGPGEAQLWDTATWKQLGPPLPHSFALYSLAFSPDGRYLACGGGNRHDPTKPGEVRIWDIADRKSLAKPSPHPARVSALAFSPDGQTLLTACHDGQARRWKSANGEPIGRPLSHDGALRTCAVSPDGRLLLTGGVDGRARLWDVATEKPRLDLLHASSVNAAAFSPNGRRILTGCEDHTARMWNAADGRRLGNVMLSPFPIQAVAFHPSQPVLAIACGALGRDVSGIRIFGRGEARLWDASALQPLAPPLSDAIIHGLAFSPDGRTLLTSSSDYRAHRTDIAQLYPLERSIRDAGDVIWVRYRPDGKAFLTVTAPKLPKPGQPRSVWGEMRLWDAADGKPLGAPMPAHTADYLGTGYIIHFSPDGRTLWNYLPKGTLLLRDAGTGRWIGPPLPPRADAPQRGQRAVFSADGKQLCILAADAAHLWDIAGNRALGEPLTQKGGITATTFHPEGKSLLTAGGDGAVCLWDLATRRRIAEPLRSHPGRIKALHFAADGRTFLSVDVENTVAQWRIEDGRPTWPAFSVGKGEGMAMLHPYSYSADGQYIVTNLGHSLWLWDASTGRRVAALPKTHQVWSAKGDWLALIAGDVIRGMQGEVRLWDARERKIHRHRPPGSHLWLDIRGDGRMLATGDDEAAWFWDVATGKQIGPPLYHPLSLIALQFSPDGRRLLTCCGDDTARIWDVPPPLSGSPEQVKRWVEAQTGKSLDATGTVR